MQRTTLIESTRLSKTKGKRVLLDDVSLRIDRGDFYALAGNAGSGKTAFVRTAVGLAVPTTGTVRIMGIESGAKAFRVFERVGFLPADPPIRRGLSVRRDLEVSLMLAGVTDPKAVGRTLALVGLEARAEENTSSLGDDDRRLVGIARAIAHSPELLVLDEPTRGLGGVERQRIIALLQMLSVERQVTIVASTRIADGLVHVASRVGVIRDGRLVEEFSREGLRERGREHVEVVVSDPAHAAVVLEEHLGCTDFAVCQERLIRIYLPGHRAAEINATLVTKGVSVTRLAVNTGSLEDLLERLAAESGADQ